jgi:E-phenylitaconyl-CoA hydratase
MLPADGQIKCTIQGGVAEITLANPGKGNALSPAMRHDLSELWPKLAADGDVRVVIIGGEGDRHFCTGAELGSVAATENAPLPRDSARDHMSFTPHEFWKPVICAVNGLVAAAGLHFVADADIVVAAENVEFLDSHVNVGAVGAVENIGLLRRLPLGTVLQMTLMGRKFRLPAERAYNLGLVDVLAPAGGAVDAAREIAAVMLENSPSAMALSKQAIWQSLDLTSSAAVELGWALIRLQRSDPDYIEGARAFLERRAPRWGGPGQGEHTVDG